MEWVIVIVSHDDGRRESLTRRLVREGFRVESFTEPAAALGFVLSHGRRISGMIMETARDAHDGFRICKNLRELNSQARIVALTSDERALEEATRAGFFAFLSTGPLTLLVDVLRGGTPAS